MQQDLFLGIDVGTGKIAAVLAGRQGDVQAVVSRAHGAEQSAAEGRAEQDAEMLLERTWEVVAALPDALKGRVRGIGVTGQMHGVVLLDARNAPVSPLVTWQDQRCLEETGFLDALCARTGCRLYTGYGLATLAWLHRHRQYPSDAVAAATIQDLVVAHLGNLPKPVTDPSDAASWGCFDLHTSAWDEKALEVLELPLDGLPVVHPFGRVVARLDARMGARLGLPEGLPLHVASGDLQASLVATLRDPDSEIALTLGTGGQTAVVTSAESDGYVLAPDRPYDYWPYPGGRIAVVAASLCGGAAWAWLADSLRGWLQELGLTSPARSDIFDRLSALGLESADELLVHPHFLGERHDPALRGAIHGLTLTNATLGSLARGLARAIVRNLYTMLPPDVLRNRSRVVGSGNALRRTPLLQYMVEDVFGLPLVLAEGQEEAATGAALVAAGRM